jgi:hypothetical protein
MQLELDDEVEVDLAIEAFTKLSQHYGKIGNDEDSAIASAIVMRIEAAVLGL